MFILEDDLHNVDPGDLRDRFRAHLSRAGIADTNGLIIGHLEAAYCRQKRTGRLGYAFHIHLVCDENARAVIETPRGVRSLKPKLPDLRQPVRVEPMKEHDLRHVLGYCFMAFWRSRSIAEDPEGIDDVALPRGGRLPDEAAGREWLWRDQQSLADMSIVVGTRAMSPAFHYPLPPLDFQRVASAPCRFKRKF
ncbi:hypothetical protein [Falsiroseomonas sp. E2-1-a20]|uniref:hypothetical protein n=1 Tax=Falsiroseomonas sp. E2-1-a20 TaxID=3239300 RepID=UPI003F3078A9